MPGPALRQSMERPQSSAPAAAGAARRIGRLWIGYAGSAGARPMLWYSSPKAATTFGS